jgi:hypothetical protein
MFTFVPNEANDPVDQELCDGFLACLPEDWVKQEIDSSNMPRWYSDKGAMVFPQEVYISGEDFSAVATNLTSLADRAIERAMEQTGKERSQHTVYITYRKPVLWRFQSPNHNKLIGIFSLMVNGALILHN